VYLLVLALAVILSPIPLPIPSPTTLGPKFPPCPVSRPTTLGGGLPPLLSWTRGSKTYDWRAAVLTLFVLVLTATCTMARQDLTPGLAPSQHSFMQPHFTPTSPSPTPLHLVAISILAVNCLSGTCHRALSLQLLRTELTSPQTPKLHTPWQSIQKNLGCTLLLPSPKSVCLWGVHRHRTGWRLVGVPFRSTLQTVQVAWFR